MEKIFGNKDEVLQAAAVFGCLSFIIAGGIGLGLGWIFLGFLQGIGAGLVSAFVVPTLGFPIVYYIGCKVYESQNKTNIHDT
jgi:hypothetical protein